MSQARSSSEEHTYPTHVFHLLFKNMTEGVALHTLISDQDGNPLDYIIDDINPAFEQQTGISLSHASGALASELYGQKPAPYLELYAQVSKTQDPARFQTYFPPLDRHFDISVIALPPNGFATIFLDITDRVRTAEKNIWLAKFPSENPNPILRFNQDGLLLYANEASSFVLKNSHIVANSLVEGKLFEAIQTVFKNNSHLEVEVNFDNRIISFFIAAIPGEDYVNVYGRDITDKKLTEKELQRQKEDLLRSNAELEQFAYVASHDLQEPLRMVTSYVQLLERRYKGRLDAEADEFIGFAVDGATRMALLINDLLEFSRVGRRGKSFTLMSTEESLKKALSNLQSLIIESKAQITYNSLPTIFATPVEITQVFQNLIANAIKFCGDNEPHIHITALLTDNDRNWQFSIRDNGIGIDPQFHERIFVIFQRLHKRSDYQGTGIGLALCKKIIQFHKGKIWVESEEGKGSTFHFTIPNNNLTQE